MVLTMTLSPRVERKITVSGFRYGQDNPIGESRESVSGRGIRIGRALQRLGDKVLCMGFCSAEGKRIISQALSETGILRDFIEIPGALRMRITIFDEKENSATRCTQQGTAISAGALEQMEVSYARNLTEMGEGDVVVLGGDTPLGMGTDVYATLVGMAKDRTVRTVLAAQGELLKRGMQAGPYAALLSRGDLERLAGEKLCGEAALCAAAREILERSKGKYLCVDEGSRMLLISKREALCASVQGEQHKAGDGAVAGLAHAIQYAAQAEHMLRCAAAGRGLLCQEGPMDRRGFEQRALSAVISQI